MIIDTTKHKRCLLDLKQARMDKLESLSVSLSKEVIEVWYLGKAEYHGYGGFDDEMILKLRAAGAMLSLNPSDTKRACNNCGRFLEDTKKQQAFGRLYKCPGCSVAWWGKPSSLPADQETRTARKLTADMMKLVKSLAPGASLKHQLRPLGVLNKDEARFEKFKLVDLSYTSKSTRLEIAEEASVNGLLSSFEFEIAKLIVQGVKSIKSDKLVDEVSNQETCNHNWGWAGIDEACTHCGITKKALLFGGKGVDGLKEPQDLYDDLAPGWLAKALIEISPKPVAQSVGMLDPAFCPHNWDFAKDICKLCGITKEALYLRAGMVQCAPVQEPKPARLIDLE